MINLMPPEERKQLAAARTNSLLMRYVILTGIVIGVLIVEMVAVYFIVSVGQAGNEAIIADNTKKTVQYTGVKNEADEFRSNLSTAKFILGRQVPYTTLMLAIANNLPAGAALDKLVIDPATFGTPTTLNIQTESYSRAIEVKTALQNAKVGDVPIFSSVSFQSVASTDSEQATSLPYNAIYNVTYSKAALEI